MRPVAYYRERAQIDKKGATFKEWRRWCRMLMNACEKGYHKFGGKIWYREWNFWYDEYIKSF